MIYKFYPDNEHSYDALINQYLWFSRKKLLQDPKDLCFDFIKGTWLYRNIEENYLKIEGAEKYIEKLAVSCFTRWFENDRMWQEYASKGRGFVLMFDDTLFNRFNDSNRGIRFIYARANYFETNDFFNNPKSEATLLSANLSVCPDFRFQLDDIITKRDETKYIDNIFKYLFTIKQSQYYYEEENRLLLGLDAHRNHSVNITKISDDGFKVMLPNGLLKGVIAGENCSSLLELRTISRSLNVPLYQYPKVPVLI